MWASGNSSGEMDIPRTRRQRRPLTLVKFHPPLSRVLGSFLLSALDGVFWMT